MAFLSFLSRAHTCDAVQIQSFEFSQVSFTSTSHFPLFLHVPQSFGELIQDSPLSQNLSPIKKDWFWHNECTQKFEWHSELESQCSPIRSIPYGGDDIVVEGVFGLGMDEELVWLLWQW